MYQRFNPHWRRTTDWYKVKLWTEKKFLKPHPLYPIFKLNETKNGYTGVRGLMEKKEDFESKLHNKIIRKYPDIMSVPIIAGDVGENPIRNFADHPLYLFINKHNKYMSGGFTDEKAFELTERDMSRVLRKEKFEKSVVEGLATSNRARSLMGHFEQLAEYEAKQKIKQIQRDEGRYKRYEEDLQQNLENIANEKLISLEFNRGEKDSKNYEPATYRISAVQDRDKNSKQVQDNFTTRSEKILDYFRAFANIKDGISSLSDKEIFQQARETPKNLKESLRSLNKRLEKHKVTLNQQGKVDLTSIKDKNILGFVKKNQTLVNIALLSKDIEYSFPHRISVSDIRDKILNEIDDEQNRLEREKQALADAMNLSSEDNNAKELNYEKYFDIDSTYNTEVFSDTTVNQKKTTRSNKTVSYEEYMQENAKAHLLDKDILDMNYEYWESPEEKEERLRIKWIESKRKLLSNIEFSNELISLEKIDVPKDSKTTEESIQKLSHDLCKLIRDLRFKIDQNLLKQNKHPMFGSNYKYYKGDEFMLDADHEFYKIKKFLRNDKTKIISDSEIGHRYEELLETLKRKKILENTYAEHYNERAYHQLDHGDIFENEEEEEAIEAQKSREFEKYTEKSTFKYTSEKISTEDLVAAKENKKVDDQLGRYKERILSSFESALGAVQPKKIINKKASGVIKPTNENKAPKVQNAKKRQVK